MSPILQSIVQNNNLGGSMKANPKDRHTFSFNGMIDTVR
jgi:hypothetical protein